MLFEPTAIPEVILITPQVHGDERGFFMETYQAQRFGAAGLPFIYVQDNHSGSQHGTLRGLHYQIRQPQGKVMRVLVGDIYDVAVDLRRWSPTFGRWVGIELSAKNRAGLWVPPGFAHGFYVQSEWAEVAYKATEYYAPEWERTLLWNDPALNIAWPIPPGEEPTLSPKDSQGRLFTEAEVYERDLK
ncbi:MAG: dTDP-4-dehydrorhamnose 3,5-epimerase [Chloroflexi bacterium RBG_16_54_11]|nr:MAG: dTDP-4-dehydrorhamnose 3,5-epimerase [Chloroflexi bacterium RBG_16_54_11]